MEVNYDELTDFFTGNIRMRHSKALANDEVIVSTAVFQRIVKSNHAPGEPALISSEPDGASRKSK